MKRTTLLIAALFLLSVTLFSQASTGDYKVITVKKGETLDKIARKYLKHNSYKSDLLKYNHITASQIKLGKRLKIPYSLSKDRAARVKFLRGHVMRKTNGKWFPVRRSGTVLLQHDVIKTGNKSKVELRFDDGSLLQLSSNSIMSLKEYSYSSKGRKANVNLKKGSLFANVNKLRRKSSFRVSTVTAVAGVRGTQFYVSIDKKKRVRVEVYKGKVEVSANNKVVSVKKNQKTEVANGETPDKPTKLTSTRRVKWLR
ncbi:MAG: hypothetical protein IEMM0008_0396 [bacterium]|nr:MAG: hypothetical protein IEMM0008_0396 [bacterium]